MAVGLNYLGKQEFASRQFFWCTGDNLKFSELPAPLMSCGSLFDQIQASFTGEFEKVIVQGNGKSQVVFLEKEVLAKVQVPARGLSELDRLSYVVC